MSTGQDFLRSGAVLTVRWSPSGIEAGSNTAHSEFKDVMTKVQSFVSTEKNGDQLELGTFTRENAVQGSQQLSAHHHLQSGRNKV